MAREHLPVPRAWAPFADLQPAFTGDALALSNKRLLLIWLSALSYDLRFVAA